MAVEPLIAVAWGFSRWRRPVVVHLVRGGGQLVAARAAIVQTGAQVRAAADSGKLCDLDNRRIGSRRACPFAREAGGVVLLAVSHLAAAPFGRYWVSAGGDGGGVGGLEDACSMGRAIAVSAFSPCSRLRRKAAGAPSSTC